MFEGLQGRVLLLTFDVFFQIPDDSILPKQFFCIPRHYEDDIEGILIPRGLILDR